MLKLLLTAFAIFNLILKLNGRKTNAVNYISLSADTVIRNPERGLCYHNENNLNTPISDKVLGLINNTFTVIRDAGFKCVVRFGYQSNKNAVGYYDPTKDALPSTRMIQLRYPIYKRILYSSTPLNESDAYSGSTISRIGHHNQCFLASDNDKGTYYNRSIDYPYLEQETKYVPQGGETCGINKPRSDCPTALVEIEKFHWSYLDVSASLSPTLTNFNNQGCFEVFKNRLGYRFELNKPKTIQFS